ncbi:MAG: GNAT family N-acetyltransferase [Oscillospiraceae bacterium]|nr:GNAT family N-acetyltransferase [Oscillospiraceae bacterium]
MAEIQIRLISKENAADINIKNEPFAIFGRMVPSYKNGEWSYSVRKSGTVGSDVFPDENYDFDEMENEYIFIGAYEDERCIGLAILQKQWYKYVYLHDLKVNSAFRGQHIGTMLIDKACECAKEMGYSGVWTIGQDNNLGACLFYIKSGFRIGGLDTEGYNGTKLEGTSDIRFYKDI